MIRMYENKKNQSENSGFFVAAKAVYYSVILLLITM